MDISKKYINLSVLTLAHLLFNLKYLEGPGGFMPKTHSVDRDVDEFCGWERLMSIISRAPTQQDRALIATLFLTGGRVSEVLSLKRSNFDLSNKEFIVVKKMPVEKRFKVMDKVPDPSKKSGYRWLTKKLNYDRTFPINRKEPPVPILLDWLGRFKGDEKLFDTDRTKVFLMLRRLGPDIYPHWFRAQRASQLAVDYEDYDVYTLMDFFKWKDAKTAMKYSKLGWKGLARKMRT